MKYNIYKISVRMFIVLWYNRQNTLYPQRWKILQENFLHYLDLCYVNPAFHKIKDFPKIYYRLNKPIRCKAVQKLFFAKSATFGVKGILLSLVPLEAVIYNSYWYKLEDAFVRHGLSCLRLG